MALSPSSTPNDRRPIPPNGDGESRSPTAGSDVDINDVTPAETLNTIVLNSASWGAILAGVALSVITQVILNMVGIGIGAGVADPSTGGATPEASSLTLGAGIWWAISGIIAAFVGGWAAGRLSGKPDVSTAAWHGLTTWAVATLVVLYLLSTAVGSAVGGSMQMFGSLAAPAAQSAVRGSGVTGAIDPLSLLEARIRANSGDKSAQINEAVAEIRALVITPANQQEQQRQRAVQALARAQGIPPEQAATQVQQYEQQYRQTLNRAQQAAANVAGSTARTLSWSALIGALALALGGLAGWVGGRFGAVDPAIRPIERFRAAMPERVRTRLP